MSSPANSTPQKGALVLVAGGSGKRMGGEVKKEFLEVDGKPVIVRALDPFLSSNLFDIYVIVITAKMINQARKLVSPLFHPGINLVFTEGGETRQKSVFSGLEALKPFSPDIVLIHDGARPWITEEVISRVFHQTVKKRASIPVVPAVNAIKEIDEKGKIIRNLDRTKVVGAQTPQGFLFNDILKAHKMALKDGKEYPDDGEIFSTYMGNVFTTPGDLKNKKITYREDLE